ncbi:MAG: ribonuclease HI [Candidatus Cloacimonetes bacterium]|nr:ribonuclease HI [Candidatus Cloacimonadota bacterium]
MKKIKLYTDGSCLKNPGGRGGYAAILLYKGSKRVIKGGMQSTTNNQMEMMAVLRGLEAIKEACHIDLYSDSQYVLKGLKSWIHGWKKNNWKTKSKQEVKNVELWQQLDQAASLHSIEYIWVKGHSGDPYNEEADQIAYSEAHKFKKKAR